ncbi:hypothetical protein R3P38DRAFT_3249765 [Favolaschia claudopus]|uniref:F-box domain-containing protein n=1 Tax=Favolaschia claudopus TaxID=2862362 RepID=A0AAW0EJD0_9AGAR
MSFFALAPELQLSVVSHLPVTEKSILRLVCRRLNDTLLVDVPLEQLRCAQKDQTIFLADGAKLGELGSEPFVITDVRKVLSDGADTEKEFDSQACAGVADNEGIVLDIYYPKFMGYEDDHYRDEECDEEEWEIGIHMKELVLYSKTEVQNPKRKVEAVSYDLLRGKLLRASAALLRSWFQCPECGNSRSVCPGCGGFRGRYPDLRSECGWSVPCPVCIGYGAACDAINAQEYREEFDELWERIDKMLEEERPAKTNHDN